MTASPAPVTADASKRENWRLPLLPVLVDGGRPQPLRRRVSAIVTTFNEAESIAGCLESLAWCDEVLVVDSHSTDGTRQVLSLIHISEPTRQLMSSRMPSSA